jgi:hypothetical protein
VEAPLVVVMMKPASTPSLACNQQTLKHSKVIKMKQLSFLVVLGTVLMLNTSCEKVVGEGPTITQNRAAGNFSSVASSISADVYYTESPDFEIEITAQQNILDVIETFVVNDELQVKFKNNVRVKHHESIMVNISAPVTHGLRISGSGNLLVSDSINTTDLHLGLSGSGNINAHTIKATALDASISGSGNITVLNGIINSEKLKISGSGNIDVINVEASSVNTATSGSGETRVNASKTLDVSISGSGSVYYRGTPIVNTQISGSGKVIHQ